MIRRPPRSTLSSSSAASDVYKRQCGSLALSPKVKQDLMLSIHPEIFEFLTHIGHEDSRLPPRLSGRTQRHILLAMHIIGHKHKAQCIQIKHSFCSCLLFAPMYRPACQDRFRPALMCLNTRHKSIGPCTFHTGSECERTRAGSIQFHQDLPIILCFIFTRPTPNPTCLKPVCTSIR